MSGREHEYRLRIRGIVDSSVRGAMERMQSMMNRLERNQRAYNNANKQANELRPYIKSLQAMAKQIESIQKAKTKLGELSNAIRQSQQNLSELTSQRIQAMQRVQSLERQRNTSRDRVNQTRYEQESLRNRQNAIKDNLRILRTEPRTEGNQESIRRLTLELTELQRKSRELREIQKSQAQEATRYNSQYRDSVKELEQIQRRINTTSNQNSNMRERYQGQIEAIRRLRTSLSEAGVDVNRLAEAEARLRQQIEQTNNQMNQQTARQNRLNQAQSRFDQAALTSSNAYSNFQGAVDTAKTIMNPFRESVMTAAVFEKEMSRVKAISGASESEMVALTEKAREVGRTSQFKASETASAEYYMALAGWTPKQMIAALPSLTDLAAAADIGIQRASDVITDEMTAFRIDTSEAKNVQTFVDQFVQTTRKANTDAEQLHEAMKYAAPVMQTIGMTTAESFAFAGSMANSGIKGSMAGTSMRQIGLRIGGGAKNAKKAADAMGISLSDAQAQQMEAQLEMERLLGTERTKELNSIENEGTRVFEIMRAISESFKGMSEAEQVSSAQMLFGTTAVSGGLAVLKDFQTGKMDELHGFLKKSGGAAAETAATMNDNLLGAMTRFDSAVESISITFSQTFSPIVRDAYETLTSYVTNIESWVSTHQELARNIAIAAAGFSALIVAGTGLFAAFTGIQYIISGIGLIAAKISLLPNIFTTVTAVIRGAFLSLAGLSLPIIAGLTLLAGAAYLIYDNWSIIGPAIETIFTKMMLSISQVWQSLQPAINALSQSFSQLMDQLSGTDLSFLNGALSGILAIISGIIAAIGTVVTLVVTVAGGLISTLMNMFASFGNAISELLKGNFLNAGQEIVSIFGELIKGLITTISDTLKSAFDGIGNIISSVKETFSFAKLTFGTESAQQPSPAMQAQQQSIATVAANTAQIQQANIPVEAIQSSGIQEMQVQTQSTAANLQTLDQSVVNTSTATIPQVDLAVQTTVPQIQQLGMTAQESSAGFSGLIEAANSAAVALSGLANAVSAAVSGIQAAAMNASANISASMASIPVTAIAHNAAGGIYSKGAFLTTFAEDSAEAAIPLDGSNRAISLWQQAGQILGVFPSNLINAPSEGLIETAKTGLISSATTNSINPSVNISFTINGNADSDILNESANKIVDAIQQTFEEQYLSYMHERSRVAFT